MATIVTAIWKLKRHRRKSIKILACMCQRKNGVKCSILYSSRLNPDEEETKLNSAEPLKGESSPVKQKPKPPVVEREK